MDSAKNGRWIIPFKKFGMVRVNYLHQGFSSHYNSTLNLRERCEKALYKDKKSLKTIKPDTAWKAIYRK